MYFTITYLYNANPEIIPNRLDSTRGQVILHFTQVGNNSKLFHDK